MSIKTFFFLFAGLLVATCATGQESKSALSVNDFASWNVIQRARVSNDGRHFMYELNPGHGDGELIVRDVETAHADTLSRGYSARIAGNSALVAFKIKPQLAVRRKAELEKMKGEKSPKDSLGILVFGADSVVKYPKVKSFKMASEGGGWLAFLSEEKFEIAADTSTVEGTDESEASKKEKKQVKGGKNLVIVNPATMDTMIIRHVTDYNWSKNGKLLVMLTEEKDSTTFSSVKTFTPESGAFKEMFRNEGVLKNLAVDEQGEQVAFLFSGDTTETKSYQLIYGNEANREIKYLTDSVISGLPSGWCASENGRLDFAKSGKRLYFGTAPCPVSEPKDSLMKSERPGLDLWAWTDVDLQPYQKLNADKERKRTYLAICDLESWKTVQLADSLCPDVRTNRHRDEHYFLGIDDSPYRRAFSWTGKEQKDYYLISADAGEKKLLAKGMMNAWMSPAQNYLLYYNWNDSAYYSVNTHTLEHRLLTKDLDIPFYDELNDVPTSPDPYGIVGWTENDVAVLVYDRYDIWQLDPSGKKVPVNLTNGEGRHAKTRYRYLKLDVEMEYLPKEMLLHAFNEENKKSGYATMKLKRSQNPEVLLWSDHYYGRPQKAKNAETILFSRQSYHESPTYFATDRGFAAPQKLTEANPQQRNFKWGDIELVEWVNFNGKKLQGLLLKPENFDATKKYPMMVYFYERSSDNLHRYWTPAPSRSTISKSLYVSNDYLIFIPDIIYRDGYPGQSAYDCIVSGVHHLITNFTFVDKEHMALQGQSWGGYQTAWLITKTDLFAAAMAGAPVSNMTSAYGGIRWGSGVSRMFQYEHGQSRQGGSLWDKPLRYIENSPIFFADKVNTPLMMMHNDNDGAVPWYQGIEYFVALRRLNKPVWMVTYNGEPHNLKARSWGNRMDLSRRMFQFFEHYLKGKPAPQWMKSGVPAIEKGKSLGY